MKIKFNELKNKHLEQVRLWRMLPEVTTYMYTDPIITEESQVAWYNNIKKDNSQKNWVVSVDEVNIGFVNLKIDWTNKRGFWAYYIGDQNYISKGIGGQIELNILRYAFEILNLHKLTCEVFVFNEKVIKIHEKYGSQIEGTLHDHIYKNGKYYDVIVMGILKNKWILLKEFFDIVDADFEDLKVSLPDINSDFLFGQGQFGLY